MTIVDYSSKVTHREHLAWLHWLNRQYDEPSLTDWYLIQLTAEVRSIFARVSSLEQFRLKFSTNTRTRTSTGDPSNRKDEYFPMPSANELAAMKARWLMAVGYGTNLSQRQGTQQPKSPQSSRPSTSSPIANNPVIGSSHQEVRRDKRGRKIN